MLLFAADNGFDMRLGLVLRWIAKKQGLGLVMHGLGVVELPSNNCAPFNRTNKPDRRTFRDMRSRFGRGQESADLIEVLRRF